MKKTVFLILVILVAMQTVGFSQKNKVREVIKAEKPFVCRRVEFKIYDGKQ
jgi:hypothetical protein